MSAIDLWVPAGGGLIANNRTGEAFELEQMDWHKLALIRKAIVDARPIFDDTARLIDTEIARRLDADNDRSITVGSIELRVNAPMQTEWDVTRLQENLAQLVGEGRLAAGVPPRAVKTEVSYKPVARELSKLVDHDDPRVRELVRECRHILPARRRVQVTGGEHVNY